MAGLWLTASVVKQSNIMNRVHQNALCKALFAGKVGHLAKNSNAAGGVLVSSLRATLQRAIRSVARSQCMPNTFSNVRLPADPLESRCSKCLTVSLH